MRFESENSLFRKPGNSSQLDLKSVVNTVVTNVRDKLSTVNKIDTKLPMAYLTKQVSNESYSVAEEHVLIGSASLSSNSDTVCWI